MMLMDDAPNLLTLESWGGICWMETLVRLRDGKIEAVQNDAEATYALMIKGADFVLIGRKVRSDLHNQG
jgi:methionyl-tRNA formyltransferase